MPPLPKPPSRRQRRNHRGSLALVPVGDPSLVAERRPSAEWLRGTVAQWLAFWGTDEAKPTRLVELNALRRLFDCYDEVARCRRAVRKDGRLVEGSQGQRVAHPLLKYIDGCLKEMRAIEDRLGLNRRALVAMGASFASTQRALAETNQVIESDDDDPRIAAVQ